MKSIIIILSILLVSLKSISQNKPTRQSFQDSIYNSSNTLTQDFIKIKYVGLQNHPLPPIYIEKEGECNTSTEQCSCVATRSFYGGYFTYAFLVSVYSYDSCKKWVLENMQMYIMTVHLLDLVVLKFALKVKRILILCMLTLFDSSKI